MEPLVENDERADDNVDQGKNRLSSFFKELNNTLFNNFFKKHKKIIIILIKK